MAVKNTNPSQILEEFIILTSKKIDKVAKKVRSGPVRYKAIAELLKGLSEATQKSASNFAQTIRSLPKKEGDAFLSALEKSGLVNTANLLIPVLRSESLLDDCFTLHEAAKTFAAMAALADYAEVKPAAALFTMLALAADIAAQSCDETHAEAQDEQLNHIEAILESLEPKIDFIMDLPPGVAVPPVPPDETPTSLTMLRKLLEVAKKFYKFEGSFKPTFRKDKQLIRIGPLATSTLPSPPVPILVTGLIDLSGMQTHDVVTITTKVLEPTPSPKYVIWRVKTFTGPQSSGIKHFQDFADLLEVPGDGVEVLIAQSASTHNFDPAFLLTIPYQFLVETTVMPDFNVS